MLAGPRLRSLTAAGAVQDSIWREIDGRLRHAEVEAPTRGYRELYRDEEVSQRVEECLRRFRPLRAPDTVGVVAVAWNRVIGADVFSDPRLLDAYWDKLCRAYAAERLHPGSPRVQHWIGAREVRRFLHRCLDARFSERHTPGAGRLLDMSGPVEGQSLVWRDEAVHVGLFAERGIVVPLPRPGPVPWDGPRLR